MHALTQAQSHSVRLIDWRLWFQITLNQSCQAQDLAKQVHRLALINLDQPSDQAKPQAQRWPKFKKQGLPMHWFATYGEPQQTIDHLFHSFLKLVRIQQPTQIRPAWQFTGSGRIYEALWQTLIRAYTSRIELLLCQQPIYQKLEKGKQTIGEIDFLYLDHLKQHICQLEVAHKDYLWTGQAQPLNRMDLWVGPNAKDQLAKKIAHLIDRQTQLITHPQSLAFLTSYLSQKGQLPSGLLIDHLKAYYQISGNLYLPFGHNMNPKKSWLRYQDWPCLAKDDLYLVLPKAGWIGQCPLKPGWQEQAMTHTQVQRNIFPHADQTTLLLLPIPKQFHQVSAPTLAQKLMLVPNQWPKLRNKI